MLGVEEEAVPVHRALGVQRDAVPHALPFVDYLADGGEKSQTGHVG